MASRVVQAPNGQQWAVRRRWAPRLGNQTLPGRAASRLRRIIRWAKDLLGHADITDIGCLLDDIAVVFGVLIVLGLVVTLLVLVVVPLLVALLDLVLVLLLAVLGVLARVVFRRPWTIEARSADGAVQRWPVVGWRASRERRDEIAALLASGIVPPP
jgi:hypothetical protein